MSPKKMFNTISQNFILYLLLNMFRVSEMIEKLENKVLEAILNTMPIEISFIDQDDEVKYFNKNDDRIFPRPRSIIGKKVQQCHPEKNLYKVIQIINAFKSGKKNIADFWIDLEGREIYIRYFPVRNNEGKIFGDAGSYTRHFRN